PTSEASAARALNDHLVRTGVAAEVQPGLRPGTHRIAYAHSSRPLISVIIPNKDFHTGLAKCVDSVRRSTYQRYEILVVENHSTQPDTFAYYEQLQAFGDARV